VCVRGVYGVCVCVWYKLIQYTKNEVPILCVCGVCGYVRGVCGMCVVCVHVCGVYVCGMCACVVCMCGVCAVVCLWCV